MIAHDLSASYVLNHLGIAPTGVSILAVTVVILAGYVNSKLPKLPKLPKENTHD
jgi:hypothetical protein